MRLAAVAVEPVADDLAVEGDPLHLPPLGTPLLKARQDATDLAQQVRTGDQVTQVVDGADRLHRPLDVELRKRVPQVMLDLLVAERQQQQRAEAVGAAVGAVALHQVGALLAQRAEEVGAAGDQHP